MRLRRDASGQVIGIVGVRSVAAQARQFLATGLERTPVFIGGLDDVEDAAVFMAAQLVKHGESSVRVVVSSGSVYMARRT